MSRIKGVKAHTNRLKKLSGERMIRAVGAALFAGGEMIQTEAQISITTGAVSGKMHVASKPGEAPNNDTGVLANNIETVQKAPLVVEVSSNAPYASDLENGTSEMEARPSMGPARDKKKAEVIALVNKAVDREIANSRSRE